MKPLTIITTVYEPSDDTERTRLAAAEEAIRSWLYHLVYPYPMLLHIADDGSPAKDYTPRLLSAADSWTQKFSLVTTSIQQRGGVGASLNRGIRQALENGDLLMYLVDDWVAFEPLSLMPWVNLLEYDPSIGAVRLSHPHPDLTGTIKNTDYGWVMKLDRHHYAFGFRPTLYHRRFFEAYGAFPEGTSAWECERIYNEAFCRMAGPDIVYALPDFFEPRYPMAVGEINP